MKWLLSGLFTVELYGLVVLFCVYQSPLPALWMLPFVFVTGAANIVYALRKASFAQQTKDNRIHMLLIKLLAIPYFILNFWFCISVAVVPPLTVPFIGIISLGTIPFTVAGTFFLMLVNSSYSIADIVRIVRVGKMTRTEGVIHAVFQMIFIADVLDTCYLYRRERTIAHKQSYC